MRKFKYKKRVIRGIKEGKKSVKMKEKRKGERNKEQTKARRRVY